MAYNKYKNQSQYTKFSVINGYLINIFIGLINVQLFLLAM